jgi:uncharacterized protein
VAHSTSYADLPGPARWDGADLILRVQVQPRASCDEFSGIHGNALKIRLNAPPVDGKANEALVGFLADTFAVPKKRVTLLSGAGTRTKRLRIERPAQLPKGWPIPAKP